MFDRKDPDDLSEPCKPYGNLGSGLEFIIPISKANPVLSVQFPMSNQDLYDVISVVNQKHSDVFIGVHETKSDNAKAILDEGFSEKRSGEMSVVTAGLREDAVFTWHFIWDIRPKYMPDDMSAVIVTAPRQEVIVSDMSASVTVPTEKYIDNFTMDYPEYIHCLRKHGPNSPLTFEEDIIQDISSYNPSVSNHA